MHDTGIICDIIMVKNRIFILITELKNSLNKLEFDRTVMYECKNIYKDRSFDTKDYLINKIHKSGNPINFHKKIYKSLIKSKYYNNLGNMFK